MWLKLKIFFGYVILVLLSFFIIYQFRQEQMLRHTLRKKEKELVTIHRLTEKSYIGLLDLSTHAEIAITWNDDDLREYSRKRHRVCDSLQLLKEYVHTPLQKSHIDSLSLLLCLDCSETGCTAKRKYVFPETRYKRYSQEEKKYLEHFP